MQHISFFCGREPVTKRVVGFVATSALGTGPVREISRYPSSRLGLTGARGGGRFKLVERCTHFRAWPRFQHGCVNVVAHLTARLCVALVALSPIEATRLRRSVYFQGSRCLFFFSRSVVNRQTAACTTITVECCLFTLIYCHSSDIVAEKKKTGLEREGTKPALILTKIRMFMFSLRKRRTGRERCHTVFMFTMRTAIHPDWLTLTHSFGA